MNVTEAINTLNQLVPDPSNGLPEELFYYISKTTPLINVDLLIKDEKNRTLLSWRDDPYCGKGWHIPGGIIRVKEKFETRIKIVAKNEIGIPLEYNPIPIAVNELIDPECEIRGHFISFLFQCFLSSSFVPENKGRCISDAGYLKWHEGCPPDILKYHEKIYRSFL
jgi:colanic acid biosynthesis protein WcaH